MNDKIDDKLKQSFLNQTQVYLKILIYLKKYFI